ncbi:C40 family peptidase [Modestobacter roseus]|uniref:Cell wall-associated NlpC family hydrolase n=1 Tax=Modestobacter roseus TaxID=1181884 RepID=A0A562IKW7_9ACTN|nr:NlpC/P60 family protein [Modestobacter roseus]MQA32165.1 hydrolase [Modestobacter roseus]TWH71661.1 cell wall-associated NlpC family hydrolase [Modestobacter roseus]
MSTQVSAGRRVGARLAHRAAAVVTAVAVALVVAPGVAAATPGAPSDAQLQAAEQARADAAGQVGTAAAQLAGAQADLAAAQAQSAIALDTFQGKQAEYETAQAAAETAAAAARRAAEDLTAARGAVADFARTSYQQGSTSPGIAALLSAGGPAEVLERAALLDAAGLHRTDVLAEVTVAEQQATAADAAARESLAHAEVLRQDAAAALAAAEQIEAGARQQAAAFAAEQSRLQAQLDSAQQTLSGLQGARAAAEERRRQEAAAASSRAQAQPVRQQLSSGSSAASAGPRAGAGSASSAETAIDAAERYLGTIYSWGGGSLSGPSVGWGVDAGIVGFDCSGLTRYAYAQAGISIPRNSRAQYSALPKVARAELQRGDLVFWATDTSNAATIHHVAIYLGDGRILEAPQSGSVIRVTSMRWGGFIGGVRPSA